MTSSSSSGETSSEEWRKRPAVQLVATSCQSLPLSSRVLSLSVSLLLFLQRHQLYQISVCMLSCFSHVQLFVTLWTVAHQAPLSIVFSRQEYWSGLPCLPSGDLPNSGTETSSWQAGSLPLVLPRKPLIRLGPTQIQYDLIWTWIHLQNSCFQIRHTYRHRGLGPLCATQFNQNSAKFFRDFFQWHFLKTTAISFLSQMKNMF